MNFAEDLMVFLNTYCGIRKDGGSPVYLTEMATGLTQATLTMLKHIKDDRDRAVVRAAIIEALGDDAPVAREVLN
jgi:hypothetical protein